MNGYDGSALGALASTGFSRRSLLQYAGLASSVLALAACGAGSSSGAGGGGGGGGKKILFVGMAYGVDDPFHANEMQAIKDLGKALGSNIDVEIALNAYDARLQVAQIEQLAIKKAQYDAIAVHGMPITPDNALPMVRAAEKADVWLTTEQFKPNDLHPWEESEKWISHVTFDNRANGQAAAEKLFEAMGGQGKFAYIEGAPTDTSARGRKAGMMDALKAYPGIELLESQTGKWSRPDANQVAQAWLQKYGNELTAIACGNDNMAMGALAAVQAAGRQGEILLSGIDGDTDAVGAIKDGLIVSSVALDSYWLGMIGPAISYEVINGNIDVAKLENDKREWFARTQLITTDNAGEFLAGSGGYGAEGGFQTLQGGKPDPKAHVDEVQKDVWARFTGPSNIDY